MTWPRWPKIGWPSRHATAAAAYCSVAKRAVCERISNANAFLALLILSTPPLTCAMRGALIRGGRSLPVEYEYAGGNGLYDALRVSRRSVGAASDDATADSASPQMCRCTMPNGKTIVVADTLDEQQPQYGRR